MTIFDAYARYYDLNYRDKDYAGEAAFVAAKLREHAPDALALFEIGCGTGRHAAELATRGYTVHGIDISQTMLQRASLLAVECAPGGQPAPLSFELGDARAYRAGRTFDAVISLFHVMSYQATNADLAAALETAAAHLHPGGIFLFDCWYGPAVLTQRPERRERVLEGDGVRVVRVATPRMDAVADTCEVTFDIDVTDVTSGDTRHITEAHLMRYLFSPEVALMLDAAGFDLVESCEFGTGAPLSFTTWNGCFIARLRG